MSLAIGTCFHRDHAPPAVVAQARATEDAGYDEFWVIEDCFFTSGPSLAAAALATTTSVGVGIGIMPAAVRNPAVTAMEIATLAGLGPGRFHAGVGHGVQSWMAQIDERKASPLTVLSETLRAVRQLLAGETVSVDGRYVTLDEVTLDVRPEIVPPVSAGVRGPKSLQAAGRLADGTILADFVGPDYVSAARETIEAGVASRGAGGDDGNDGDDGPSPLGPRHRITVFATMAIAPDGDAMRAAIAPFLAEVCAGEPASLTTAAFWPELAERAAASSWFDAVSAMPADWWHQIAAVGTPDDAAAYLAGLEAAGADAVAFFPDPTDAVTDVTRAAPFLLP